MAKGDAMRPAGNDGRGEIAADWRDMAFGTAVPRNIQPTPLTPGQRHPKRRATRSHDGGCPGRRGNGEGFSDHRSPRITLVTPAGPQLAADGFDQVGHCRPTSAADQWLSASPSSPLRLRDRGSCFRRSEVWSRSQSARRASH
jgi:hypothetical protein